MRLYKRLTAIMLAAVLSAGLLTGCGDESQPTQAPAQPVQKVEDTKNDETPTKAPAEEATEEPTNTENSGDPSTAGGVEGLTKEEYDSMTADDLIAKAIKNKDDIQPDEYAWLASTYAYVNIVDEEDDVSYMGYEKDNKTSEAFKILRDQDAKFPKLQTYLDQLLANDSPQVRGFGASKVASLFGVSDESLEKVKALLDSESDTFVLYKLTDALSNEMKSDEKVAEFIFRMSENENPKLRYQSAIAIGNSWTIGVDGAVDKILQLMEDENDKVKKIAMHCAGKLQDTKVIKPLKAVLEDESKADFHGDAADGLFSLAWNSPFYDKFNGDAWKIIMNYLKKKPRSNDVPSWSVISDLDYKPTDKFNKWAKKSKFYNTNELYKIMVDIIKDKKANWLGRSAAIRVVKNKIPKKFGSLAGVVKKLKDDKASLVQDSYKREKDKD